MSSLPYSRLRNDYNAIFRAVDMNGVRALIFDMTEVKFFGSLFLGSIMQLALRTWNNGGTVSRSHRAVACCGVVSRPCFMMHLSVILLWEKDLAALGRLVAVIFHAIGSF